MKAKQQVIRERRHYNQWVANQTLEDFALRFTAKKARRWSLQWVAMTALGATAFMALEAIGGSITLTYGYTNAVAAIFMVGALLFITGLPISYYAARYGVDIDLLTRGAGFGYLGSTITSLIYASFTFIFFAIEAAILAVALERLFGVPVFIGYIICAVAVIPIVTHGITTIGKFQIASQFIWLALQLLAIVSLLLFQTEHLAAWTEYVPAGLSNDSSGNGSFNLALFGGASAILFAMIAQIGEQADYLRFLPDQASSSKIRWWAAVLFAGPGWIIIGILKMLLGSFMAYLAFVQGAPVKTAADPSHMYQAAFENLLGQPQLALALACILVIVCQLKINVTNAYAGSIAWSNFFSRVTHTHPGRVVWLVFNVTIALLLMEFGIYRVLENILGGFAIVAISWLGTVSADLMINKPLGLSPKGIEFKRGHLYDINPVGLGSMFIACCVGVLLLSGLFGSTGTALAHYLTLASTFISAPLIAWLSRGKYYIAREASPPASHKEQRCSLCENHFESEDMSHCPAYGGAICSLCCSLDVRCHDLCRPQARADEQVPQWLTQLFSARFAQFLSSRAALFTSYLSIVACVIAGLLWLIHTHLLSGYARDSATIADALLIVFCLSLIISGVVIWITLLTHESRLKAIQESNLQTQRLEAEIAAHNLTDQALQAAKDTAEAANQAKSRYLSGISHELRTPLNAILGYAQLLSRDANMPAQRQNAIATIQRSGEHLSDLIEGLLDISKIEAGRLEIQNEQIDLHELLAQLVQMFQYEAQAKNLAFHFERAAQLPRFVRTDGKQLRQVLINLLSNAIKFTAAGSVSFRVTYRYQVTEFEVRDTGIGLSVEQAKRIFEPFERLDRAETKNIVGTGLGLTISKLLVDIMGGELKLTSEVGVGSCFTATLLLSRVDRPVVTQNLQEQIVGYHGETRTLLITDDQRSHRELLAELLRPLGFNILLADSGASCLAFSKAQPVDLYLVDIAMPQMSGHEVVQRLREAGRQAPIIMVSANAEEHHVRDRPHSLHDDYLSKPVKFSSLLDKLGRLLDLQWRYSEHSTVQTYATSKTTQANQPPAPTRNTGRLTAEQLKHPLVVDLASHAELGYLKGVRESLQQLRNTELLHSAVLDELEQAAQCINFRQILAIVTPGATH